MKRTLSVATWNLSGGRLARSSGLFDYETNENLDYFVDEIRKVSPDIICLPETHLINNGTGEKSLTLRLAERLDIPYSHEVPFHQSHIDPRYILGLGLISSKPFKATDYALDQPEFPLAFKNGAKATPHTRWLIEADFGSFTIATVHNWPLEVFQHSYVSEPGATYGKSMERQYIEFLPKNKPLIVAGDLNFDNPQKVMPNFIETFELQEALDINQPTRNEGDRPDHILYNSYFNCTESKVVVGKSEHYLCFAKFELSTI